MVFLYFPKFLKTFLLHDPQGKHLLLQSFNLVLICFDLPGGLQELQELGIWKIKVAFDMDAIVNENVRAARNRVLETGCDAGFDMTPLAWDPQHKGIDDFLFAAKKKRMK